MYLIKIFKFSLLFFVFILAACTSEADKEAKKLGFANGQEMKELQAKGFKSKSDYLVFEQDQKYYLTLESKYSDCSKNYPPVPKEYKLLFCENTIRSLLKEKTKLSSDVIQIKWIRDQKQESNWYLGGDENNTQWAAYRSMMITTEINCKNKKERASAVWYSDNLAAGKKIHEDIMSPWDDVILDVEGPKAIFDVACHQ